jgi:hypothetical protein
MWVQTPYGVASQEFSTEALSAGEAVQNGATFSEAGSWVKVPELKVNSGL